MLPRARLRAASLRSRAVLTVVAVLAVLGLLSAGTAVALDTPATPTTGIEQAGTNRFSLTAKPKKHQDPRRTRGLFVDPKMPAYLQGGVYRKKIGKRAQAFWVIPETYPTHADPDQPWKVPAKKAVAAYVGDALAARKTPVLTIYGIPGRDCGQYSSNNPLTTAGQYRAWIKQVAKGLGKARALVILEPDALPFFSSTVTCSTRPHDWQGMLRFAAKRLGMTKSWVYLDAGHSNWTPYDDRPRYLKEAGVKFARGISTNVSNFRPTADEKAYAQRMLTGLRKLGIKGKHYVIDTSRNRAAPQDDNVINPTWARVGKPPKLRFQGPFDGTLWVKHPGESDGYEHGGPESGDWCDFLADRLLQRRESSSC